MVLSETGRQELEARIRTFLADARHDIGDGRIDAAMGRYALPLALIRQDGTEIVSSEAELRVHLNGLAGLSSDERPPFWRQEIVEMQIIDTLLVTVTADVFCVDCKAKPLPPERQTLILRRSGTTFRYVAIVNPIRHDFWTNQTTA
jgi:hypothetical protein